jgi:hypothetical protein
VVTLKYNRWANYQTQLRKEKCFLQCHFVIFDNIYWISVYSRSRFFNLLYRVSQKKMQQYVWIFSFQRNLAHVYILIRAWKYNDYVTLVHVHHSKKCWNLDILLIGHIQDNETFKQSKQYRLRTCIQVTYLYTGYVPVYRLRTCNTPVMHLSR